MLKRDLSDHLFSRELQALDGLFSREPEDWAEWAVFARGNDKPRGPTNRDHLKDLTPADTQGKANLPKTGSASTPTTGKSSGLRHARRQVGEPDPWA